MGPGSGVTMCPKGHPSAEPDYCSECGAKIAGGPGGPVEAGYGAAAGRDSTAGMTCPDCGSVQEPGSAVYCEVCGFNFATGAHGEIPQPPAVTAAASEPEPEVEPGPEEAPPLRVWTLDVSVDPALRGAESPEPPPVQPFTVELTAPVSLIGRRNEARAIFPDIALDYDEAVSRRHALLQIDGQHGLSLRDIGAANGTRVNGKELSAMTDYALQDGDEITLGHWSRIRVHSA